MQEVAIIRTQAIYESVEVSWPRHQRSDIQGEGKSPELDEVRKSQI